VNRKIYTAVANTRFLIPSTRAFAPAPKRGPGAAPRGTGVLIGELLHRPGAKTKRKPMRCRFVIFGRRDAAQPPVRTPALPLVPGLQLGSQSFDG